MKASIRLFLVCAEEGGWQGVGIALSGNSLGFVELLSADSTITWCFDLVDLKAPWSFCLVATLFEFSHAKQLKKQRCEPCRFHMLCRIAQNSTELLVFVTVAQTTEGSEHNHMQDV